MMQLGDRTFKVREVLRGGAVNNLKSQNEELGESLPYPLARGHLRMEKRTSKLQRKALFPWGEQSKVRGTIREVK